ncbi:MAG: TIGR04282 family arsenosugar biosynthesis glycosyltransferase [Bacteroidia bacterium]|nr:TIGR04282 family arsenosugar biosynthesis glycosyltransferase [Bacteroidia bacterium]
MAKPLANNTKSKSLLIIFYRNPELGKVKTRLAETLGDEKALAIYIKLSSYTRDITENLTVDKVVFYSQFADTEDHWPNIIFQKKVQRGNNLGERMHNAFLSAFADGYKSACIIGTDCLELSSDILEEAFSQLINHDAIIGPTEDGGYYLLGMNKLHTEVFKNKTWSTVSVFEDTLKDFRNLKLNFVALEKLTDVDTEADLLHSGKFL